MESDKQCAGCGDNSALISRTMRSRPRRREIGRRPPVSPARRTLPTGALVSRSVLHPNSSNPADSTRPSDGQRPGCSASGALAVPALRKLRWRAVFPNGQHRSAARRMLESAMGRPGGPPAHFRNWTPTMIKQCIVPRLATALGLTAAFAVVTLLASSRSQRPA